ncbi:hypothetical protein JYU20_02830 [Bacteroidales bacterium AH-315-I05]|nr:hypothetical protein [Bacteroidales bacterium AH-315-I05]
MTVLLFVLSSLKSIAGGDGNGDPDVNIHVFENGETWTVCSFILNSSLTQSELARLTREAGNILYFQPLTPASLLGKFKFEVSLGYEFTPIDQTSGAWNNTFAHPDDEHWLGDAVVFPYLQARMGLTDRLEIGGYVVKNFGANYGFWGTDLKYTFFSDTVKHWYAAYRLSYTMLYGPADLSLNSTGMDVLLSKRLGKFEPYVGGSLGLNHAKETTEKLNLNTVNEFVPRALAGMQFLSGWFTAGVEYDVSIENTFSIKIGGTF